MRLAVMILSSILCLTGCGPSPKYGNDVTDVDLYLLSRFPYGLDLDGRVIKDRLGYRTGEYPLVQEAPCGLLKRRFPLARFYLAQLRTNEWHLTEVAIPALVGSTGRKDSALQVLLPWRYLGVDPDPFLAMFLGARFETTDEKERFVHCVADLLLLTIDPRAVSYSWQMCIKQC